ncbi:MAG: winged helix-turn-helix domain-containing protein [Anaerolineae bacterium]
MPFRSADLAYILNCLRQGADCSIVGVSNMGKSALLRQVPAYLEGAWGAGSPPPLAVYVDCNAMLEMTDQGFYEVILRAMGERLAQEGEPSVLARLREAYEQVVGPEGHFRVALGFNEALRAFFASVERPLALLLDEFDEPLAGLPRRVFLNLRALKDRCRERLSFVTATNRRLPTLRHQHEVLEFCELFALHTYDLGPLSREDAWQYVQDFAQREGVTFDEHDFAFICQQAGGHPGLMEVVCRCLGRVTGKPVRDVTQDWLIHREVRDLLAQEPAVQAECARIWSDLLPDEQEALLALVSPGQSPSAESLNRLFRRRVVVEEEGEAVPFCHLLRDYLRRQHLSRKEPEEGVQVDVDSGEVWVDGRKVPTLTNLEFRLLLLLYGRVGKICDKYQVVEAVWGQEYLDEVDDARIEKLVSRLRHKLEEDPNNPKYLVTVRGRGYRLMPA